MRLIIFSVILATLLSGSFGQFVPPSELIVHCLEPYVICNGTDTSGFSIDFWRLISSDNTTSFIQVDDLTTFVSVLTNNQTVMGISGLSVTPYMSYFLEHSYPYHRSILRAVVKEKASKGILSAIGDAFASKTLWEQIVLFALLMFVVAHIMWGLERNANKEQIHKNYSTGIWDGFYWSATTSSTVGYGDIAAKTNGGRTVSICWMFVSLLCTYTFSATLTSLITLGQLQTPPVTESDIQGNSVAAIFQSNGFEYARRYNSLVIPCNNLTEALKAVQNGTATFVLHEQAGLSYFNYSQPNSKTELSGPSFGDVEFSFSFAPSASPEFKSAIDQAILNAIYSPAFDKLLTKYFNNTMTDRLPSAARLPLSSYVFLIVVCSLIVLYIAYLATIGIVRRIRLGKDHKDEDGNQLDSDEAKKKPPTG